MARNAEALGEFTIEGEAPLLIEPGLYDLAFDHHVTCYLFGRAPKVVCYFRIVTQGPYFEMKVRRFYNVKTLTSKPRRGGAFKIGWHSDFIREFVTLFGRPERIERISTERFKNAVVRGKVATVDHDSKGRVIPQGLRYSVVKELTELVQ